VHEDQHPLAYKEIAEFEDLSYVHHSTSFSNVAKKSNLLADFAILKKHLQNISDCATKLNTYK
jgi:hypothetical protein